MPQMMPLPWIVSLILIMVLFTLILFTKFLSSSPTLANSKQSYTTHSTNWKW